MNFVAVAIGSVIVLDHPFNKRVVNLIINLMYNIIKQLYYDDKHDFRV